MDGAGRGRARGHWKVRKESGDTHSAISSSEAIEFLLAGRPYLSRRNSLDTLLDDLPELVVFFSDEQDDACRLGVEAARHVQDGVADDFFDPGLRDGDGLVEGVDGAAILHGVEEGVGLAGHLGCGRHFGG